MKVKRQDLEKKNYHRLIGPDAIECPNCGWRCFSKEEWEHHECGENVSDHSKILAVIAYWELVAEMMRRAPRQTKLSNFVQKEERRPWYYDNVLGVNDD